MEPSSETMITKRDFEPLTRQGFRRYFQPSRILLGVIPAPNESGVNVITLCFSMYCSYKPPMLAVAIHNINASFDLMHRARAYVLAVPGEGMLHETMFCGTNSMSEVPDKVRELRLDLLESEKIPVPGLSKASANIELVKETCLRVGDHLLVVGRAVNFRVKKNLSELPLLSIGPNTSGYRILAHKGIHRVGIVDVHEK